MDFIFDLLGINASELTATHMASRAVFVFIASYFFMRIAGRRTFGKKTIFDQITLFIVGALLGKSIVTNSPFLPSMLAVLILVFLHRMVAFITFKSKFARGVFAIEPVQLVRDGELIIKNMNSAQISKDEIMQSLRLNGHTDNLNEIKELYLEPSGDISIIKKEIKN